MTNYDPFFPSGFSAAALIKMGAPRKWIKQLLGLKKSEKIASSEEENNSGNVSKSSNQGKQSVEIEKDRFENELNDNVETEFEDANWQWDLDQSGVPSTSLQAKNSAQVSEDRTEEWSGSPRVAQQQSQQDWREEWMGMYGKDANFQSALDSPTSPEEQNAAPLDDDTGEGWATPDVRELNESDDPSSPPFSSIEVEYALLQDNIREELEDVDAEDADSPSTLHEEQSAAHIDQNMQEESAARSIRTAIRGFMLQDGGETKTQLPMSEESAAIRIQTVYRGFLARRAFRAVKGLARLHALVKSHTVKRQAAIALRCIQALVKVQAQSRAKHVRIASENQSVQLKLIQQLEVEAPAPVKKPEGFRYDGWCDKVGSAAEVQARLLKRKEAAAKREKAKAYALARQWQAGIRQQPPQQQQSQSPPQQQQQVAPVGFHSDKSEWGWNWLERWMAVRPWQTPFLDEAREAMKSPTNERVAAVDVQTSLVTDRKPLSSNGTGKTNPRLSNTMNVSIEKRAISHADGWNPSPRKLATAQDTLTTPVSSRSPRTPTSRHIGSRSFSTPRERSNLSDNQEKKRLSLPGIGTMHGAKLLAQTAVKSPRTQSPRIQSPRTPQTPGNSRSKLNGNDARPSNLSR